MVLHYIDKKNIISYKVMDRATFMVATGFEPTALGKECFTDRFPSL